MQPLFFMKAIDSFDVSLNAGMTVVIFTEKKTQVSVSYLVCVGPNRTVCFTRLIFEELCLVFIFLKHPYVEWVWVLERLGYKSYMQWAQRWRHVSYTLLKTNISAPIGTSRNGSYLVTKWVLTTSPRVVTIACALQCPMQWPIITINILSYF